MKSDLAVRLKEARENAGFASASEAARRMGVSPVTYTAHENGGREYDREAAIKYADNFKVSPAWLLFGEDFSPESPQDRITASSGIVNKPRSKLTAAAGEGSVAVDANGLEEFWEMPDEFIRNRLRIQDERARVLEVIGDSMYDPMNPTTPGSMYPGDRVIVDLGDTLPTPPGPFAVHDGAGVVIRIVETIPHSSPQTVRLSSRNPRYATYECATDNAGIIGRIKAKVSMIV